TTEKNAINYLMTGADSRPLPTSVVIGKDGKVAFIGTPDDLDEVLPHVLSGSWKLPDSLQERRKIQAELDDILAKIPQAAEIAQLSLPRGTPRDKAEAHVREVLQKAATKTISALAEFATKHPLAASNPLFHIRQTEAFMLAGQYPEARKVTETLLAEAQKHSNWITLQRIVDIWSETKLNPKKLHVDLGVRAADELLAIEGNDKPPVLVAAAKAYAFAGDKNRAQGFGDRAMTLVEDPRQKEGLRQALDEFLGQSNP
ncbi:MAG: hypothetical protein ACRCZF_23220, partial [Gemmataceae bacterium]